jgi:hypothetical protein
MDENTDAEAYLRDRSVGYLRALGLRWRSFGDSQRRAFHKATAIITVGIEKASQINLSILFSFSKE